MNGKTQINETGTEVTIKLDADESTMRMGSHGTQGNLQLTNKVAIRVFNADGPCLSLGSTPEYAHGARPEGLDGSLRIYGNGRLRAKIDASATIMLLGNSDVSNCREIELDGQSCAVRIGEPRSTVQGRPALRGGDRAIELRGNNASVSIGREDIPGRLELKNGKGQAAVQLDAHQASLTLGAIDRDGDLFVRDGQNRDTAHLDGAKAALRLGTSGVDSSLSLVGVQGRETVRLDAAKGELSLGAQGVAASLRLQDAQDRDGLVYDGMSATLRVGTSGNGGRLLLRDSSGAAVFDADADLTRVTLGAGGRAATLVMRNAGGKETIQLDGASGDILLTQADCAEEFDFDVAFVTPGTVVVIGDDERLTPSTQAYDRRVAGVVSGAGRYRPAIVLDRQPGSARPAVAMIGKVECFVDARHGPIRCGDLLVSSPTPGHAMVGSDKARTPGAVLGKALRGLETGTGLIPILVCLQ